MKKGTRMLRWRTLRREGNFDGQPWNALTHPDIPSQPPKEHFCGECFRPRSTTGTLFCYRCERVMFGIESYGYMAFIRSEMARRVQERVRRYRAAGVPPASPGTIGPRLHYWDGTLFYGRHKYPCGRVSAVADPEPGSLGFLFGSGRRETTDRAQVTCRLCLRKMEERDGC